MRKVNASQCFCVRREIDLPADIELDGANTSTLKLCGKGPAGDLANINDATFNRPEGELVGILLTYAGGVVMHKCKTLRCKVSCSQESEGAATEIGRQFTAVARDVCRALGDPQLKPTFVATDNLANSLVAMDAASASKSRHFLRRYYCILQDVKSGDVRMGSALFMNKILFMNMSMNTRVPRLFTS